MKNIGFPSHHWLLIANGASLSATKLHQLAKNRNILVLDGAYKTTYQAGITPDILLGDFDSIENKDLQHAQLASVQVIEAPDQNKSDLQKGLEYLDSQHATDIYICAATGRRLQHTLYNLHLLKKYHQSHRPLTLFSETEIIRYYTDTEVLLTGEIKDSFGLLGFPVATVTTSGLKYNLENYLLDFEKTSSVLNELAQQQAHIKVEGDLLLIHEVADECLLIS